MASPPSSATHLKLIPSDPEVSNLKPNPAGLKEMLGIIDTFGGNWVQNLPFAGKDATAGSETELQTAVIGPREKVDLPLAIEGSSYFRNMAKQASSGEAPLKRMAELEAYLDAKEGVWENSWVRFSGELLNAYAQSVLESDMRSDKRKPDSTLRCDVDRFFCTRNGKKMIRIPVSYLLKPALADAIGDPDVSNEIQSAGSEMMAHFLNDNTSPETHSFHPVTRGNETWLGGGSGSQDYRAPPSAFCGYLFSCTIPSGLLGFSSRARFGIFTARTGLYPFANALATLERKSQGQISGASGVTPFGPEWLDRAISRVLGLKGDYVIDFRITAGRLPRRRKHQCLSGHGTVHRRICTVPVGYLYANCFYTPDHRRLAPGMESGYNSFMSNPVDRHFPLYGPQSSDRLPHHIPCPPRPDLTHYYRTGAYEPYQNLCR